LLKSLHSERNVKKFQRRDYKNYNILYSIIKMLLNQPWEKSRRTREFSIFRLILSYDFLLKIKLIIYINKES